MYEKKCLYMYLMPCRMTQIEDTFDLGFLPLFEINPTELTVRRSCEVLPNLAEKVHGKEEAEGG